MCVLIDFVDLFFVRKKIFFYFKYKDIWFKNLRFFKVSFFCVICVIFFFFIGLLLKYFRVGFVIDILKYGYKVEIKLLLIFFCCIDYRFKVLFYYLLKNYK